MEIWDQQGMDVWWELRLRVSEEVKIEERSLTWLKEGMQGAKSAENQV